MLNCDLSNTCITLLGFTFSWIWIIVALVAIILMVISLMLIIRPPQIDQPQTIQITNPTSDAETTDEDPESGALEEDEENEDYPTPKIGQTKAFHFSDYPADMTVVSVDSEEQTVTVDITVHLNPGAVWTDTDIFPCENYPAGSAGWSVQFRDVDKQGKTWTWDLNPDGDHFWEDDQEDGYWQIVINEVNVVETPLPTTPA